MGILLFFFHSHLHELFMGQNFWGASGQNASPSPAPVSPQRRSAPTLLISGALNRHNRQQLAADGCERRPQTQMASKRVCRRPATSSLRRWLHLCAQNFCLVSCGANQIKTNQLEAIAPILLTENSFSRGLRTMHITQSARSSVFKPSGNV